MPEMKISQKKPYLIDEKPRKVAWCACGESSDQPYCDGSHKGSDFRPLVVNVEKEDKIAWCGCRHSNNKPYCDGSHSKL